jgi:hypothetical protein
METILESTGTERPDKDVMPYRRAAPMELTNDMQHYSKADKILRGSGDLFAHSNCHFCPSISQPGNTGQFPLAHCAGSFFQRSSAHSLAILWNWTGHHNE